ncbi:MAG: glycerol-3-phosphate dehydrogenase/oxidase [Rhodoferax sp.]|nr:glycerol-3-phosphate dehydrogenase/oxidase [Rhodoferax sp.]
MTQTPNSSASASAFRRPQQLNGSHFQVVIVGSGINGVGTFRDLCLQGVKCLMIDKGDIGSGASSAPSRMIHGGLRYLENAEFSLVKESAQERNNLLLTAPHLIKPLQTVIPLSSRLGGMFGSALRFLGANPPAQSRGVLAVALGLTIYDFMGRKDRTMPRHWVSTVSKTDQALLAPDVRWTAHFYDAWITHPERLMHELIADAHHLQPDAVVSNYCELIALENNTVVLQDRASGTQASVTADVVINATGAWLESTSDLFAVPKGRMVGTKGSHLVLDHPALAEELRERMVYFEARDGRVCIVYPFMGRVLAGSTDIPVTDPDAARTENGEIDYLLSVLNEVFPRHKVTAQNIVYTYVGVRPLATIQSKGTAHGTPGKISRDHHVVTDAPTDRRSLPVVNLVGGKWTTFRSLAEEATDAALQILGLKRKASTTGRTIAPVGLGFDGSDVESVRRLCRLTGVVHLSDVVLHRSLDAILGRLDVPRLEYFAHAIAAELGWDANTISQEVASCRALLSTKHNMRHFA